MAKSIGYFERVIEKIVEDDVKELEPILLKSIGKKYKDEDDDIITIVDQPILV